MEHQPVGSLESLPHSTLYVRCYACLSVLGFAVSIALAGWRTHASLTMDVKFTRLRLDLCILSGIQALGGLSLTFQQTSVHVRRFLLSLLTVATLASCILSLIKIGLDTHNDWWHLGFFTGSSVTAAMELVALGAIWSTETKSNVEYMSLQTEDLAEDPPEVTSDDVPKKYRSSRLMALAIPEVRWLVLGCVTLFIRLPFSLSLPHFVSSVISGLISDNTQAVQTAIICFIIAGTIDAILDFWCVFLFGYTQQRIIRRLRLDLFHAVLRQEVGFFDQASTGNITSRLTADCAEMANNLTWVFRFTIEALVRIGGISGYMFYSDWRLALVAYALIPIIALGNRLYGQWLSQNSTKVQTSLAEANAVAVETIGAMRTVFAFANEHLAQANYSRCIQRNYRLNVRQTVAQSFYYMFISTFLMNMVVQAALLSTGAYLTMHGRMGVQVLVAFMLYQAQLQEYFSNLLNSFTSLIKSIGAGTKVFELLDRQPVNLGGEGVVLPHVSGRIDFHNVCFSYPSSSAQILKSLSFSVFPGKVVAIVGSSGAGKSTIFYLLENFYRPTSGTVKLDGVEVCHFNHRWLHTKVALVGQEPVLFSGTVEENILYGLAEEEWDTEEARQKVRAAAITANAHQFIEAFPLGYKTEVGEHGVQLSGGQRQRIAIARAIIQDPAVLLLDEATSALDSESEAEVQKGLEQSMQGRTVLVIAHRLSTIARADCILVLDGGAVVEMGSHEELMARSPREGISYRALVEKQASALEYLS